MYSVIRIARFAVSLLLVSTLPSFAETKLRVGVVEFEIKGNVEIKDAGSIMAEWVNASITKTGKYTVIERLLLRKVLEEQELELSGLIDEATATRIGGLYGVEAIVSGSVLKAGFLLSVSKRVSASITWIFPSAPLLAL